MVLSYELIILNFKISLPFVLSFSLFLLVFYINMLNNTVVNLIESILNGNIKRRSCVINPCNICNKTVKNKQNGILCDTCDRWFHVGCNGTSEDVYYKLIQIQIQINVYYKLT